MTTVSLATEFDGDWADPLRREAATLCREARHLLAAAATATGQADVAEQASWTRSGPTRTTSAPTGT